MIWYGKPTIPSEPHAEAVPGLRARSHRRPIHRVPGVWCVAMTDRAARSLTDVVAVDRVAPGLVTAVTWSGTYLVDARAGTCTCEDFRFSDADRCKHQYAALLATSEHPSPWDVDCTVTDGGSPQIVADGGTVKTEGLDHWTVHDRERDKLHNFDSRAKAEEKLEMAADLDMDAKLFLPGELPDGYSAAEPDGGEEPEPEPEPAEPAEAGPGETVDAEVVEHVPDAAHEPEYEDLPDRSVAEDPLDWVPQDFIDVIDGSPAINRRGFEVLSHFYNIEVRSEVQVPPEETDFEFCRVKATAVTDDGRECEAFGSAHVDRGDDSPLLLEMADTRARKRALSIATGVGAVAVEELRNEVER